MSTSVEMHKAAPTSAAELAPMSLPNGGQGIDSFTAQGLSLWLENFRKYETTLQEVAKASAEPKFRAELDTVQQWFKVLPEAGRTATVHALMQNLNQDQIRFFISALQQMIRPDVPQPEAVAEVGEPKGRRPPSLNIPLPGSPTTPTPVTAKEATPFPRETETEQQNRSDTSKSDALSTLDNKTSIKESKDTEAAQDPVGLPGLGVLSPFQLNMLANAGLSTEAQLLAVQLIMSGVVQPVGTAPTSQRPLTAKKPTHLGDAKMWRTPTSAKYPRSALQSSGLRASALKSASLKSAGFPSAGFPSAGLPSAGLPSAGLQSAGLKSSGLDSPSSMATPREEDFDPEMLNDIPAWLRSLRLHKYTWCFDGLTWQEMVVLDDATLETKGVVALGARRRLLRTFEHARKKMGMEDPDIVTPTTSTIPQAQASTTSSESTPPNVPLTTSKLSITSPVFVPSFERVSRSASPTASVTAPSA